MPLIQDLVRRFQEIICHLTITHVWLLRKSKLGDGFQGWHQDKSTGITNTIVYLGRSNNNSNNEDNKMVQDNALMDNNKIQQSMGVNYSGNKEGIVRKEAMEKKKLQARRICYKGYENVWKSCT